MKLKEIATQANVSAATVSLVLNNREGVSSEKRRQITELLESNGYRLNTKTDPIAKKNIRFLKYRSHAMLVDGNPGFVNAIVDAIEKECRRQGFNLIMSSFGVKQVEEIRALMEEDPSDGVLLLGTELTNLDTSFINGISVPLVVVDNILEYQDFSCITMNNEEAIFSSVSHLASLGHPRIGFLENARPSSNCMARRRAYETSLSRLGISFDPSLVYTAQPTPEGAYESIRELLKSGCKFPSAIVANNDSIALGAMKAFKEFELNVPSQISIIGFDSIPFSTISDPPLTTMEVSCTDMGIWAVRLLCDRILYPNASVTKMQIGTKLLKRNSTMQYDPKSKHPNLL